MRAASGAPWSGILGFARAEVRIRWRALVALGLVTGLVGGVAVAAIAGARRSSTAYDRLVATSDFADVFLQLAEPRPGMPEAISQLPSVERAVHSVFAVGQRTDVDGHVLIPVQTSAEPIAELPVVEGRAPDPAAADEVVLSPRFADQLGVDVGDSLTHRPLSDAEFADLLRDRWDGSVSGTERVLRVVGLVRTPTDVALAEFPTLMGTPALHERLDAEVDGSVGVWVDLRAGADVASLEEDLGSLAGPGRDERLNPVNVVDLSAERQRVDEAVAILSGGLVVFGALVALGGSLLVGQLAARIADGVRSDVGVLGALGLDGRSRRLARSLAGWPVLAVAVPVAAVVAVASSVATPVGVARSIEPDPGIDVNVAFLLVGLAITAAVAAAVWSLVGRRHPVPRHRTARRPLLAAPSGPTGTVARSLAFAPGPRGGRWLGVAGVGASVAGLVAASVFGASLDDLVDDPRRWGWFGDLSVEIPEPARADVLAALDAAPEVDAYAEVRGAEMDVGGRNVAAYAVIPRRGNVEPVVFDGRAPAAPEEIALGPRLADELGVAVGDRVRTSDGERIVVGLAPTFGMSDASDNVSGVLLGGRLEDPDFSTALVRVADGVDSERFGAAVYPDAEYGAPVAPADVVNLRELEGFPPLLLAVFALLGVAGIVHLARSTADRGRRDVAVLRALGMSRRRSAQAVLGAIALAAAAATAAAAPLGAVAGARTWSLLARGTDLGTAVSVPIRALAALPVLGLVIWSVGRLAGRRTVASAPGRVLRSE